MPNKVFQKHMFLQQKLEKKDQSFGVIFRLFLIFFQTSSRTWGINFDTIACVFELVDGQKNVSFFEHFFRKLFFQIFLGLSIHFLPSEGVKKIF